MGLVGIVSAPFLSDFDTNGIRYQANNRCIFDLSCLSDAIFSLEFSKQVQRLMMVDFSKTLPTQELP